MENTAGNGSISDVTTSLLRPYTLGGASGGSSNKKVASTTNAYYGGGENIETGIHAHQASESQRLLTSRQDEPYNDFMDSPNRHEINARLEAIESRMDARVAGMSAKLDTALAEMRADRETNTIRFAAMTESIRDVKEQVNEGNEQSKSLKGSVWGAALATVTIVGATVALAIASFDSGRETSKSIAEATMRMENLQAQLESQASRATAPSPVK